VLPVLPVLPAARVTVDRAASTLVIELPAVDLPSRQGEHEPMVTLTTHVVVVPIDAMLHGARVEVVDGTGRVLPRVLLHHVNLADPARRELFAPISLNILAASKETPSLAVPRLLLGLPVARGQRLLASGMLANPTSTTYRGARVRVVLSYAAPGRVFPLYHAYPWVMDVMFPLGQQPGGSKAFDLPPGRTARSWESRPAVAGRIVGLGGHLHDYGVSLELRDVTTNEVLWHGVPVREASGRVLSVPVTTFYGWRGLGVRVVPTHRYRITVVYDNPTGHTLRNGGMGAVAGLFVPDRGAAWPSVDPADPAYRVDLLDTIHYGAGDMMMDHLAP
jgi:hypothetical protein